MNIDKAHKFCINNQKALFKSKRCGCFYCNTVFDPSEIKEWVDEKDDTALCPYCGVDSVLAEEDVPSVTDRVFLEKMYIRWFETTYKLSELDLPNNKF